MLRGEEMSRCSDLVFPIMTGGKRRVRGDGGFGSSTTICDLVFINTRYVNILKGSKIENEEAI